MIGQSVVWTRGCALGLLMAFTSGSSGVSSLGAQTTLPKVFSACYNKGTGTVYRIKEPSTPQACTSSQHVEFSWTDGAGSGVTAHGLLSGLLNDDHPQYLRTDGTRALTGSLGIGGFKLTNLAAATTNGDALRFEQGVKVGDAAGGDLGGTFPSPSVAKLQGTAVDATAPTAGQVLTYNGGAWAPAAVASGGTGIANWEEVTASNTGQIVGFGVATVIAVCPAGKKATGGGHLVGSTPLAFEIIVLESRPVSAGGGWAITFFHTNGISTVQVGTLSTYAVCVSG